MLETALAVLFLVAGAVLLTAGAEAFTEHLGTAADRLGVGVLALGVVLAGAEPEVAVTAMLASAQGHPALAAGGAIGANLLVLTLVLGSAASLTRLPVSRRAAWYAGAAAAAGLLAAAVMWNGVLGRLEATVLVAVYVAGVTWVWRRERTPPVPGEAGRREAQSRSRDGEPSRSLLLVLAGLLGMVAGGYLVVRGGAGLVSAFGSPESVMGLTVLALATSADTVALVLAARHRGITEVAVAAAVGGVVYNATVTLGLAAWMDPLLLGRGSPVLVVAVVTAALPLVLLAGRRTGVLPRPFGPLLAVGYLACLGWLFTL